jgi:hydroxyacylglutathione hydrolase
MILHRFYDDYLAQASYLVGCGASGEALVIDPNRDVEQYIQAAAKENLRIVAVTETHIHADYVSGSRELADRTGATLYLSKEGGEDWQYAFADDPNVKLIGDGSEIRIGGLLVRALHTPGHTPEHLTFLLTDTPASDEPCCAFTGDFIFVGDIGRPDLLERAANYVGTMEAGARTLFESVQNFRSLDDSLLIWPGHGAGSACGKNLGGVPVTSLGYEAKTNWALLAEGEDNFVAEVLSGQPEPPNYFKEMKRINRQGAPMIGAISAPPRLAFSEFVELLEAGALIVDARESEKFAAGFVPGCLHVAKGKSFVNWAGWLLPYDQPIYLVTDSAEDALEARRGLALIGLDDVRGWFGPEVVRQYGEEAGKLATVVQVGSEEFESVLQEPDVTVLDVRFDSERSSKRVEGSVHIPLSQLRARLDEVPRGGRVLVHCSGGTRSPIAASILRDAGFERILNLRDGLASVTLPAAV